MSHIQTFICEERNEHVVKLILYLQHTLTDTLTMSMSTSSVSCIQEKALLKKLQVVQLWAQQGQEVGLGMDLVMVQSHYITHKTLQEMA